jgi:ParB family transcriptional regulator, chromosome partitioning protein
MRSSLGKGLSQLIGEQADAAPVDAPIDAIVPNQRQPRTHFDEDALEELASSIREVGILQPLVVKPISDGRYELIAGERRLRAAGIAGLRRVPITIRSAGAQSSLELALIENIQREDISVLECARAYRKLMDEFGLTQEQVADKVGKSRPAVANAVRLLRLPARILEGLEQGLITEGHAKALLSVDNEALQLAIYDQILKRGMTVREVEQAAKARAGAKRVKKPGVVDPSDPNWVSLQQSASEFLGAPVKLEGSEKGGRIWIDFYSEEDLLRIMDLLGIRL